MTQVDFTPQFVAPRIPGAPRNRPEVDHETPIDSPADLLDRNSWTIVRLVVGGYVRRESEPLALHMAGSARYGNEPARPECYHD